MPRTQLHRTAECRQFSQMLCEFGALKCTWLNISLREQMRKQHARQGLEVGENAQNPTLAHTGPDHQWLTIAQNTMWTSTSFWGSGSLFPSSISVSPEGLKHVVTTSTISWFLEYPPFGTFYTCLTHAAILLDITICQKVDLLDIIIANLYLPCPCRYRLWMYIWFWTFHTCKHTH